MCRFVSASFLKAPGELQRHEEVGGLSHAADEVVLHLHERRLAGARRDRDVVEPEVEGLLVRERAAEARAAVDAKRPAPREVQVQHVEEVLVPPHRDAVFGDAAEARQRALVETAEERLRIANQLRRARLRARELLGERLDLQAVDRDDAEALVQEMVREGVAGRPEPHDEDVLAVVGERIRAGRVERVPARQERPDLEPPGHREDVRENARLRLRDVDGILRLEDAGLHAVVADAVARCREPSDCRCRRARARRGSLPRAAACASPRSSRRAGSRRAAPRARSRECSRPSA